eukprot:6176196-Pleurochrysis_carterae.AAC.1
MCKIGCANSLARARPHSAARASRALRGLHERESALAHARARGRRRRDGVRLHTSAKEGDEELGLRSQH